MLLVVLLLLIIVLLFRLAIIDVDQRLIEAEYVKKELLARIFCNVRQVSLKEFYAYKISRLKCALVQQLFQDGKLVGFEH